MLVELIKDITKLALIVASLYLAFRAYARGRRPVWSGLLEKRRLLVLLVLVLVVSAIKVTEDVLGGESAPIDETILKFVRGHVPGTWTGFFVAVTFTGSSTVLFPLTTAATIALLCAKRRVEALLLAASVISGATLVYLIKTTVGRARPALWESAWYWGSSFPSGHTLVTAAFATAAALCANRIWPAARPFAFSIALSWIVLVGASRLVLGVHWPTDVLAAICIGIFLPLLMSVAVEHHA